MPHLDNLGLKDNPFKKNNDYRYYYADQNRAQIMEATEHQIEFSSNVQVIIGAQGMGKSHLLNTLAHRLDNNWRIATIQVNEQVDTLSLIHEILEVFGGKIKSGEELLEALENQLSDILQLGFKPVLFLDNAHHLSVDSIRFLLQLSQQQQDDKHYIKIVLFAGTEITESLQSSEFRPFRDAIHIAHLEALDKEGVSGYLRHKLAIVGFDRESPFTPRIIDSIFKDSQGIPEKVDFYANKFLASSGKAADYITEDKSGTTESVAVQDEALWQEADIQDDRIEQAEQQLNRLTEKFDEIEKLTEPASHNGDFNESKEDSYNSEVPDFLSSIEENEPPQPASVLSRMMIPGAVVAIVVVAVVVIFSVFNHSSDSTQSKQLTEAEQIELLPLELPVQNDNSVVNNTEEQNASSTQFDADSVKNKETKKELNAPVPMQEKTIAQEVNQLPELSEPVDTSKPLLVEKPEQKKVQQKAETAASKSLSDQTAAQNSNNAMQVEPSSVAGIPELKSVEPEPVIGSNKRQTITILGRKLQPNSRLIVSWGENSKTFSANLTPDQWHYINSNKVKLQLTTGIETQTWQVIAENPGGQRSSELVFDVVKPFIASMAIKAIAPEPVVGSNKRQVITIKGQGFTPKTVIELKWDKNNKHFSSSLLPEQFKYISSNEVRLYITTGTQERKWKVTAKEPQSGATSHFSFTVRNQLKEKQKTKIASTPVSSQIKQESWISQQPDSAYTVQLFSSYEQQAIERFVQKYALQGNIARFVSQRDGKTWFSLIYGSFATKPAAEKAVSGLNPQLRKTKPWIRTFASIKLQLAENKKTAATVNSKITKARPDSVPVNSSGSVSKAVSKTKDEAWIWTQSPDDYTLQLVALSNESSIKAYISRYHRADQAVYFKYIKNGKPLYILIYGSYVKKSSAEQAAQQLKGKISGSKPWIRRFSDIHNMMTVQ